MNKNNGLELLGIEQIHFIGIYGVSVSSLALICAKRGYKVSGSDTGEGTEEMRSAMEEAGIYVSRGHSPQNLPFYNERNADIAPEAIAVVHTAAITEENAELAEARRLGMRVFGRAEFMELLIGNIPVRIGVSGTHGKSTVCGMISEIFLAAGVDPDILCGAELPSIDGAFRVGAGERVIFEACEYKNSFLFFRPTCAVVTNVEEDHPDFFKGIEEIRSSFFRYADRASRSVICIDGVEGRRLAERLSARAVTCSASDCCADYFPCDVRSELGRYSFTLCSRKLGSDGCAETGGSCNVRRVCDVSLKVVGVHNLQNAVTAAAVALENGISPEFISEGLSRFSGVRRRMEYIGTLNGAVIYDDYAHHPTEIRATLAAARAMGFKFICCAFQPHTYSRTARFFDDFAAAFADADEVLFTDIYAAREQNTYGVSSQALADATKNGRYLSSFEQVGQRFREIAAPGVLLLTMGAGRGAPAGDYGASVGQTPTDTYGCAD